MHSHTRAISPNWEKTRSETMANSPPTGGARGVFYPLCSAAELAAGWRYTTRQLAEMRR